jgi:hypothetical protein
MTIPELEELKAAWQTLNRNLERQHSLALHQFKQSELVRFRSGLRPLALGQIVQLIAGIMLVAFAGQFWARHLGAYHLMIYGILFQGYGTMVAGFAVRDLILIHRIDYGAPVVVIQKALASLRAWHLRAGMWLAVGGCFIWLPLILLIPYYLGANNWIASPEVVSWLILNIVVCLGLAGTVVYLFRHGKGKVAQALRASAVGRSIHQAEASLAEIAQFERE